MNGTIERERLSALKLFETSHTLAGTKKAVRCTLAVTGVGQEMGRQLGKKVGVASMITTSCRKSSSV
jgi:hypothetical protein